MVGKTALNKERYHLNGGPFQTLIIKIEKVWTILRKKYLKNLL